MQRNYKEVKAKPGWKSADLKFPSFVLASVIIQAVWAPRLLQVRQITFPVNMTP